MEAKDTVDDLARRRGYTLARHYLFAALFAFTASLVAAYRGSGSLTSEPNPSELALEILGVALLAVAAQVGVRTWLRYGVSPDDDDADDDE